MAAVEHPAWCDSEHCTAVAEQPTEYRAGAAGEHRSAPESLDLSAAYGGLFVTLADQPVTAWLAQAVAPGRCQTMLRVGVGDDRVLTLPVDGRPPAALEQLAALVGAAVADTEAYIARELARPAVEPR